MTVQTPEKICIGGSYFNMLADPLSDVITDSTARYLASYQDDYPNCIRGYMGTWEIKDDCLFLIGFTSVTGGQRIKIKEEVIHPSSTPIKANWFTGKLTIPLSHLCQEESSKYNVISPQELVITIHEGKLSKIHLKKYELGGYDYFNFSMDRTYPVSNTSLKGLDVTAMYQLLYDSDEYVFLEELFPFKKETFFVDWQARLETVSLVLKHFQKHRGILSDLKIERLILPENLYEVQKEWVELYSSYTNQEMIFFKAHWVPIDSDGLNYFIDMAEDGFPLICAQLDQREDPHLYKKINLFKTMEM